MMSCGGRLSLSQRGRVRVNSEVYTLEYKKSNENWKKCGSIKKLWVFCMDRKASPLNFYVLRMLVLHCPRKKTRRKKRTHSNLIVRLSLWPSADWATFKSYGTLGEWRIEDVRVGYLRLQFNPIKEFRNEILIHHRVSQVLWATQSSWQLSQSRLSSKLMIHQAVIYEPRPSRRRREITNLSRQGNKAGTEKYQWMNKSKKLF